MNYHMQVVRFACGFLDHRLGDCLDQISLLFDAPAFPHFYDYKRHHTSSLRLKISSTRRLIPIHWLRPTVMGARDPMPRAHTAFSPSSPAASRSIVPGGAATSTSNACFGSKVSNSRSISRLG